jgi:hypothetical protein
MDEVRLAVEKGYKVLQVLEVYEYQVTQFDPSTGEGGIFARYIDTSVKLKAEGSGTLARSRALRMKIATLQVLRLKKAWI